MTATRNVRVAGLDAIRFLMAVVVMFSHAGSGFRRSLIIDGQPFTSYLSQAVGHVFCGPAAVAVFFLLSGFVIHHPQVYAERLNVESFLIRRWVRVALPLIVISAVAIYFGIFKLLPVWSLYCELIYYTLYPLLFRNGRNWKHVFWVALGLSILCQIVYFTENQFIKSYHLGLLFNKAWWYLLQSAINFPCWILGVMLANGIARHPDRWRVKRMTALRLAAFLGSVVMLVLKAHFNCNYTYTVVPFSVGAQYWLGAEILRYRTRRPNGIMEYAGKASYSLYLCHMVCFHFAPAIPHHFGIAYWLKIGLALLGAALFYIVVEAPSHRLARWLGSRV